MSIIVTVKVQFAVSPKVFDAMHETMAGVFKTLNVDELLGEQLVLTLVNVSLAVRFHETAEVGPVLLALSRILAGQLITGGVTSTTLTEKLQLPTRPTRFVALQLITVVPIENTDPDRIEHLAVGVGPTSSFTVGRLKLATGSPLIVVSEMLAGQLSAGGLASTKTVN